MTTLQDLLADLAEQSPTAPAGPPTEWVRGRRHVHVRRAAVAVIVAAACTGLLLVGASVSHRDRTEPIRRPLDGHAALPDRLYLPSRWLPGADGRPVGPLAAVIEAERGHWLGQSSDLVGVSATTGDYRFLDLPDYAGRGEALAPDGEHVAYWSTGHISGTPGDDGPPVTGIRIYDAGTGAVQAFDVPTAHGLYPSLLLWSDSSTLISQAGRIRAGRDDVLHAGSSTFGAHLVWHVGSAMPVPVVGVADADLLASAVAKSVLVRDHGSDSSWHVVNVDSGNETGRLHIGQTLSSAPVLSALADEAATVIGDRNPGPVIVSPVGDRGGPAIRVPGADRTRAVLGWLDERHLALLDLEGEYIASPEIRDVDARTGEVLRTVRFPQGSDGSIQVATSLLAVPTVPSHAPPSPVDPREAAGAALGIVVVAGLALLAVVRRRPRVRR